jgi:hypothetical protein
MSRPGELAEPGDAEIDPILSEMLQAYRSRVSRNIPRADARETLRVLAGMEPDEARKRWRTLDPLTKAAIDLEHYRQYKRAGGDMATYARGIDYLHRGPENIPEFARLARKSLPSDKGGHPPAFWEKHLAAELAAHWWKSHGTHPAIQTFKDYAPTPFQIWAVGMFKRVKRFPDYRTLQAGIRKARRNGRIPHK